MIAIMVRLISRTFVSNDDIFINFPRDFRCTMADNLSISGLFSRLSVFRRNREREELRAKADPYLLKALEEEKLQGQKIATYSRIVALGIIAVLSVIVNPSIGVLYYEAFLIGFIIIGMLQLRYARVGQSRIELLLLFADFALMTYICVGTNPLNPHEVPASFSYRFDVFIFFFVLLAGASLAYSWRTIWSIGVWVPVMWALGFTWAYWFGNTIPDLSIQSAKIFENYPRLLDQLDPNSLEPNQRLQEAVAFAIVAGMLALKGRRSNELLLKQANISAERANLSRYFSPNMVDVLAASNEDINAVRSQNVAVLFADINGFTKIAEQHSPEKVMELLREFHAILGNAIFANHGTLDKYLGDGIMATFGTPFSGPNDAENALNAAKQIIRDVDEHNAQNSQSDAPHFRVCVGIHYGEVMLGNIGPTSRLEFAVLGDTVNVAARLEAATRELGCRIVASSELIAQISHDINGENDLHGFNAHIGLSVKGRQKSIDVWTA